MPIDRRKSKGHIIGELINKYKKTGKIGNTEPKDMEHAQKIATAIAYDESEQLGECYHHIIQKLKELLQ